MSMRLVERTDTCLAVQFADEDMTENGKRARYDCGSVDEAARGAEGYAEPRQAPCAWLLVPVRAGGYSSSALIELCTK